MARKRRAPKGTLANPRKSVWHYLWLIFRFPAVFVWGALRTIVRVVRWFFRLPGRFLRWLTLKLRFSLSFKMVAIFILNALVVLVLLMFFVALRVFDLFYYSPGELMIMMFLAVIMAIFLSYRGMKRILEPIHEMNRQLRAIQAEDLSKRLDTVDAKDELRDLSITINALLERIESTMSTQREFVSNASHELRTPLSVLRGYADLLERWGSHDPEVLEESLRAITQESRDMSKLVDHLLFLSRVDDHRQMITFTDFSLSDLFEDLLQETIVLDQGKHPITVNIAPDINYFADETLLKECFRIFLDNARKYTPPGKDIFLYLDQNKHTVIVEIEDRGIGIETEHQAHIFDRFYRSDSSRTRSTGGSGLGLSIAKSILDMHGATVEVWSELDVGTHFRILLPLKRGI